MHTSSGDLNIAPWTEKYLRYAAEGFILNLKVDRGRDKTKLDVSIGKPTGFQIA